MREKDKTLTKCKLCGDSVVASGMGSHLYHKHNKTTSDEYVEKFGEFRRKYLEQLQRKQSSGIVCKICNETTMSHKHLLHHIKNHNITWEQYFIEYFFNGIHPICKCGCGQKVKLLRNGKNEKNEIVYARSILPGHNNNPPGYRINNYTQRMKMREAAIKRMSKKTGSFFNNGPSKGEIELQRFIKTLTSDYIFQDKDILSGLELDIVLPSYKLAFEYNGGYFHSDLHKKREYHLKKTLQALNQGYRLIHIWECDWHTSKTIIKSTIRNLLGKTTTSIYARKTKIKKLTPLEASSFYKKNHLQGSAIGKFHYGLYYKGILVSAISFSSLRKATGLTSKENSYELIRYCNLLDTAVTGGASKLFKHFIKEHNPESIISYANFDWSNGRVYEKLGMKQEGRTPPGYFYVKSKHRFSRFQFQKHKLVAQGADPTKTEYEIMTQRGFMRIWDCGNLRYRWER